LITEWNSSRSTASINQAFPWQKGKPVRRPDIKFARTEALINCPFLVKVVPGWAKSLLPHIHQKHAAGMMSSCFTVEWHDIAVRFRQSRTSLAARSGQTD
jgi:hypothetical protein